MRRRTRKTTGIPVLKLPPPRLLPVVLALRKHEYDRIGFRLSVMELFAASVEEKSVLRGMAIPTLRGFGLLLGFEQSLHLSSDGALVAAGADRDSHDPMRAILYELEEELQLASAWGPSQMVGAATDKLCALDGTATPESRRRAQRWISYLEYFGVVVRKGETLLRAKRLPAKMAYPDFAKHLASAYKSLSPKTIGEPAVAIDEIARSVALDYFTAGLVLTRQVFDKCLTRCLDEGKLPLHLHRSMGAEQKLFRYGAEVYESISLRRE